jgi:hypothetical protein
MQLNFLKNIIGWYDMNKCRKVLIKKFRSLNQKESFMAKKGKAIHKGKMRVVVPSGYKVFEKKIPRSLKDSPDFKKYDWIGNFGFTDNETGKKVKKNLKADYEVQVKKNGNKKLVYWDGEKTVKFKSPKQKNIDGIDYITAELRKGDPPVGWAN